MINIENLNMIFGEGTPNRNHVLRDLNLSVNKGDFITIVGSNGAGKTTLYNALSGHDPASSGTVLFNNKDVTNMAEYKRAAFIGRIFQDPLLGTAGNMSIEDNMIIASYKGIKKIRRTLNRKKREEFKTLLTRLEMDLESRLKNNVALLSGGQRQALTLLMMVMSRPELILLDEHTAALDPRNAVKVMELTVQFIEEYELTAMMITHNMQHAIDYGNRLIMMDKGEIIMDIQGDEKKQLTVSGLVEKFHAIRKEQFLNDEALLS
ncbi:MULTISPECIES: ABC transporter ATP-binding protein [unclassified Oceanispirochaeta]|uniref:ABC transporter ATP-binding protein n=1 Tax=unclassified Oceanispirochaeta TaxID=2635722 RepID=UPI000E099C24|nr:MULTISPECIES: ATP-binding cassette domain-containing protein [unclassified Oceanispirochaeta]MBF9016044.1 ATP-binding cassette domain-containing protein [Oceanispirochaeta sp. M2]NPD72507.1 ATP-binding cassette domain-containing protein [Oceanispirochaeta sp. M1]RDG31965.1 ATP-binding cassette domain-containing protein [Oceanispirochaeta sp. M1]